MSRRKKQRYEETYDEDVADGALEPYDDGDPAQYADEYEGYDDEYDDIVEDDYGINLQSKKKAGRYRIVSLVFLLLVIASSVGIFLYKRSVTIQNRDRCWTYQSTIEARISEYVRVNGLSANPAYIEDVPGILKSRYDCPDGGSYTWDPVNGEYFCSEHGHYPESFVTPESEVTGTEVTQVEE